MILHIAGVRIDCCPIRSKKSTKYNKRAKDFDH